MRKFPVLIAIASTILSLNVGCNKVDREALASVAPFELDSTARASDIYDDGTSTVYLVVTGYESRVGRQDKTVAELIKKKGAWEKANQGKKVVALAFATGSSETNGNVIIVGLLIHYERRVSEPQTPPPMIPDF